MKGCPDLREAFTFSGRESKKWSRVPLGEVCQLNPRRPLDLDRKDEALTTFVSMPAVDAYYGRITQPEVKPFSEVKKGYTYFAEGDVLFAKITPCMQNGKHVVANNLLDGVGFGSTEFHVIRPGSEITADWIHRYLRQPRVLEEATHHFTGAVGQQRVPVGFLGRLLLPLPPLSEQKRITAILNEQMAAVDKARAAAEERLEAAKALPGAYLRKIFPGPGQALPDGWRWVRLGELCQLINGKAFKESDWSKDGYPIIRIQNLNDITKPFNYWSGPLDKMVIVHLGDVLLAWSGTPGTSFGAHFWKGKAGVLNQHIFRVDLDESIITPEWATNSINHQLDILIGGAHGGVGLRHINKKQVEALEIMLPPLSEQKRITAILNEQIAATNAAIQAVREELETINTLPAALLRRAFNGKL